MIDVSSHISTVERRVGTRTLAAGEARTVTIARVFATSPDDLWDACTEWVSARDVVDKKFEELMKKGVLHESLDSG